MATEFCQKCQQSHPGRLCDYDENGECAETAGAGETAETDDPVKEPSSERKASGEAEEDQKHE